MGQEFHSLNQLSRYNLSTGLDLEHITNPREIYRCLLNHFDDGTISVHSSRELVELSSPREDSVKLSLELPSLSFNDHQRDIGYNCICPKLTIDEQRFLYLTATIDFNHQFEATEILEKDINSIIIPLTQTINCLNLNRQQLDVFGELSRSHLAKRVARGLRFYRKNEPIQGIDILSNDSISVCLYRLEQFIREANTNLQDHLAGLARQSAQKLHELCQSSLTELEGGNEREYEEIVETDFRQPLVMIRAPIADYVSNLYLLRRCRLRKRNYLKENILPNSALRNEQSDSNDSGIDLVQQRKAYETSLLDNGSRQLDEHVYFRASQSVQSIIDYSISLFSRLLKESSLFKISDNHKNVGDKNGFETTTDHLINLAELKLYACVECQKLRSSIRFEWITRCLEFALRFKQDNSDDHKKLWLGLNSLPPLELKRREEEEETRYYNMIALLMGQLLRRHFLVVALELWTKLIDEHQIRKGSTLRYPFEGPKVIIEVNLIESKGNSTLLACSNSNQELKEALCFVADELAGICKNLPRIETQLMAYDGNEYSNTDYEQITIEIKSQTTDRRKHIIVLEDTDDLVTESKLYLSQLLDQSQAISRCHFEDTSSKVQAGDKLRINTDHVNDWNHPDYLLIIDVVNKFRQGSEVDSSLCSRFGAIIHDQQSDDSKHQGEDDTNQYADDRLKQLRFGCKQIVLLNHLEEQLSCEINRYFDLGFALLDCEPLNESLVKCINSERSLLVRLNLDDLLKLMERLRLQFDEIEIGVDLDAAIDDYLNERWQAKQSQQPQQPIILATGDNFNDDDDNQLVGEDRLEEPLIGRGENRPDESEEIATDEDHNLIVSKRVVNEEEEFVTALNSGNSNTQLQQQQEQQQQQQHQQHQHQLSAVNGSKKASSSDQQQEKLSETSFDNKDSIPTLEDRRVAPLIECQLLVGRYEYFSDVLNKELKPLIQDLQLAFEGLIFLSEFVDNEQLELAHSELISELSIRSQEFTSMLGKSLKRLNQAKARLVYLNSIRTKVLSKLVAEYHLLMIALSKRRFIGDTSGIGGVESDESSGSNQLDSIQEASDWSQKLELRFDFLQRLNVILAKEARLLLRATLTISSKSDKEGVEANEETGGLKEMFDGLLSEQDEETKLRAGVLDQWRHLVTCISCFWRLAEKYEAQQVKWLNSDTKRIDFCQIESVFNGFVKILEDLKQEVKEKLRDANKEFKQVLEINLTDLETKFNQFLLKRLPIFKFLTNQHLSEVHWSKLAEFLIDTNTKRSQANYAIRPQLCTTLAQFLELNVDKHVDKLEEMNKQATIEHELTMFLLAETDKSNLNSDESVQKQMRSLKMSSWLENWSDNELIVAASRFIEAKMSKQSSVQLGVDYRDLAKSLVAIHSKVKHYLHLKYTLNLDISDLYKYSKVKDRSEKTNLIKLTLRSNQLLSNSTLVRPSLFVEFLRLFTQTWIKGQLRFGKILEQLEEDSEIIRRHLEDIDELMELVRVVNENDLQVATNESEQILVNLERETMKLELEREILATKEALALEKQRDALKIRDDCIRQITERAIPAIRAATRALNCLDDKSLRTLRCIRPNPPEAIRLVIEAVCLLKSCSVDTKSNIKRGNRDELSVINQQPITHTSKHHQAQTVKVNKLAQFEPERRLDLLHGIIVEDYWPVASRMLNGTHSCKFLSDLRKVDKKSIPSNLMRLIRRKYLSSSKFNLRFIGKVSHECGLLAKWLIAVDVFDRVINVVKPNYKLYIESEKNLGELLSEVSSRRREIENISSELQRMEDLFEIKVKHKMKLASSLDECAKQLKELGFTQRELIKKQSNYSMELTRFKRKRLKLASKCLLSSAETVYIEALPIEERKPMTDLIRALVV